MFIKRASHKASPWRALVEMGTRPGMDAQFRKRVVLINYTSLFFAATIGLFTLTFAVLGLSFTALYCALFAVVLLVPLLLNRADYHLGAPILLMMSANLMGLGLCLLIGPAALMQQGYYVLVVVPWLLFDSKNIKWIVCCLLLSMMGYAFCQWGHFSLPFDGALTAQTIKVAQVISSMSYFLLIFFLVFYLYHENTLSEGLLEQQRAKGAQAAKLASLGEMAGGVAHEINNPLAIIQMNADYIAETIHSPDIDKDAVEKSLKAVRAGVTRVATIVSSMRKLVRNTDDEPVRKVPLSQLVSNATALCGGKFQGHGIDFRSASLAPALALECREIEISQVLLNLLNNAYDAVVGQQDKWIRVDYQDHGDSVCIVVSDSGPGVDADMREKIFQPFFTTKDVGKGMGLGLGIARSVVEAHKGSLVLDSSSSHTRFVLKLPKHQTSPR